MHLLLLEDDADLGQALSSHLRAAGHRVHWCLCLADARAAQLAQAPDMALLDLHLPDGDGLDLLRAWRGAGLHWPVIALTASDQVSDRIRGLQAGADDYLVKPFDLNELLARIDAVARRTSPSGAAQPPTWRIDLQSHEAWRGSTRLDFTQMEWAVLACLAQRPGRIYHRNEIEHRLLALGLGEAASNSLEVIVSRLRKKLGGEAISTHRSLGYRLEH